MTITMERPVALAPADPTPPPCTIPWCCQAEADPNHTDHLGSDESARFTDRGYGVDKGNVALESLMACVEQRGNGRALLNVLTRNDLDEYANAYLTPVAAQKFAESLLVLVSLANGAEVDDAYKAAAQAIAAFRAVAA